MAAAFRGSKPNPHLKFPEKKEDPDMRLSKFPPRRTPEVNSIDQTLYVVFMAKKRRLQSRLILTYLIDLLPDPPSSASPAA